MDQDLTFAAYAMSTQAQYLKKVRVLAAHPLRSGVW
jgi:hypothetical protein